MRVRKFWSDSMRSNTAVADVQFINAARPFVPLIDAAAKKLGDLVGMNRKVHTDTYNKLIAAAV